MSEPSSNPVRDFILSNIEQKAKEIKADFSQLNDLNMPTVPEIIFVRDFLPVFSGEKEATSDIISTWYIISGGPFNKVNIIDKNGNKVGTVPPLRNREAVPNYNKPGEPLEAVFMQHDAMTHISPMAANNKLTSELDQRYIQEYEKHSNSNKEIEQQWTELLTKYGKIKSATVSTGGKTVVDDSDIEYE